jgi:UDP-N-acetylglucosamine acyltransferase
VIEKTAIIYPNVTIEEDCYIGHYCIIGAEPETKKPYHKSKGVLIKRGTKLMGHNTIDAGSERVTEVGENNFIMKGVHIGHDAILSDNVTIAPHSVIGGFVEVGIDTNIGMSVLIHQRCKVGSKCMLGMGAVITKKTEFNNNIVLVGSPAKKLRNNDNNC